MDIPKAGARILRQHLAKRPRFLVSFVYDAASTKQYCQSKFYWHFLAFSKLYSYVYLIPVSLTGGGGATIAQPVEWLGYKKYN
jgi:hypothetical protein